MASAPPEGVVVELIIEYEVFRAMIRVPSRGPAYWISENLTRTWNWAGNTVWRYPTTEVVPYSERAHLNYRSSLSEPPQVGEAVSILVNGKEHVARKVDWGMWVTTSSGISFKGQFNWRHLTPQEDFAQRAGL